MSGASGYYVDKELLGQTVQVKKSSSTKSMAEDLTNANQDIWDRFQNESIPLLRDLEADMESRRDDYYDIAMQSSDALANQRTAQADLRQSALGISTTAGQDAAQVRQESLGRTTTEAAGTNASVDTADSVNDQVAASLMNITTGVETQALNNLSAASGMASARTQQGILNEQAATQANTQAAGMALGMIAMMS